MGSMISSLLFQPPSSPTYDVNGRNGYFWITSSDHRTPAFVVERKSSPHWILFSHGNAEDLGIVATWMEEFSRKLDVNVLAYEYSGYGPEHADIGPHYDEPAEHLIYKDAEIALDYLIRDRKVPANKIILYGRSLGTGPSSHLAKRQEKRNEPVLGLVLQSAFLSAYRVAAHFRFTMPGDAFPNVDHVRKLSDTKVLLIHGVKDEIVPFWHSQEIYLVLQETTKVDPLWLSEAGHNDVEYVAVMEGRYFEKLKSFRETCEEDRG
jgi:fermentation-respiration switch protein FrsA (DUF1100 family)